MWTWLGNAGENGEEKKTQTSALQQSKNSKHTTRPMTAALEDRYFPAGLKMPSYSDVFKEQANVMQTKLYMKRSMI